MKRREYKDSQNERRRFAKRISESDLHRIERDNRPKHEIQKGPKISLYEYIFIDKITENEAIEKITSRYIYDKEICLEWLRDKDAIKKWMEDRIRIKKKEETDKQQR